MLFVVVFGAPIRPVGFRLKGSFVSERHRIVTKLNSDDVEAKPTALKLQQVDVLPIAVFSAKLEGASEVTHWKQKANTDAPDEKGKNLENRVDPMARILVIDDEELARFTMREILEGNSHVVTEAGDGLEGIQCLEAGEFDLAITDMVMPQQEGSKTIEAIKRLAPSVKVIAISGGGRINNIDHLDRAKAAGADAVLKKPFTFQEFLDTVENLVEPAANIDGSAASVSPVPSLVAD